MPITAERPWIHGATIDRDGNLNFASVSSIELGDTAAGGCPRKWGYRYIEKIKEPPSKNQERGTKGHAEVANYHLTGARDFGPITSRGTFMLLDPGPDLLVEWDLLKRPGLVYPEVLTSAHSPSLLAGAPVKLAGVPLLGNLDLSHARGINRGGENAEDFQDPEGTVEVLDWKFVGGDKYLKTPDELRRTTQMATYAEWVWQVRPETRFVRLSHGYFVERGRCRKVSTLVRREDILPQVEHAAGVVRLLGHVAREADVERTDANLDACDKYGGCYHRERCSAYQSTKSKKTLSLVAAVGKTAAESLYVAPPQQQELIPVASLLQRANALKSAPQSPPAMQAPAPDPAAIAAEKERLMREEREAKLKALIPAGFQAACEEVRRWGRGFPKLTGTAARAYYAVGGQDADSDIPGAGEIGDVALDDPNLMAQLAAELAAEAAQKGQPQTPALLPPDAPASDPRLAAEDGTQEAPATAPVTQATAPVTAAPATTPEPAPAPKKRGPKAKTESQAEAKTEAPAATEGAIHLFVDCATSMPTTRLDDWAQEVADTCARKWGADDIRCGGQDTPLGYEKWRGTLMAMVRDAQATPLPGGYYSIDTRYSSVMHVIAEALGVRAKASGGSVTRGTR